MSSGHGTHKPRTDGDERRMVDREHHMRRPTYGESNTWSGLRQAEEDAQNATRYRPSEYDDYDYG